MPAFGGDPLKELAWSAASAQAPLMQRCPHETGGEGEEGPGAARGGGGKGLNNLGMGSKSDFHTSTLTARQWVCAR